MWCMPLAFSSFESVSNEISLIAFSSLTLLNIALSCSDGRSLVLLSLWSSSTSEESYNEPTRTIKNSSKLEDVMAINFNRSRIGVVSTSASRSTRRLNFSQLSSRLKKYSGRFKSSIVTFLSLTASAPLPCAGSETPALLILFFTTAAALFTAAGAFFSAATVLFPVFVPVFFFISLIMIPPVPILL